MKKSIVVNNETLKHLKLSSDGKVTSLKKRVKDEEMIKDMLRVGSPYKLGLKQYKFLMRKQARQTVQPIEREWITEMHKAYNKAIKSKNK